MQNLPYYHILSVTRF